MGKTTESLHAALEKALELINPLPCTRSGKRTKVAESCLRVVDGKFDDEGRPTFWYGIDCTVPRGFCPSCRAYWLVAVARNAVFDFDRTEAARAADAARGEG